MQRHDVDIVALVAGVVLCAIGAAALLVRPFDPELLRWVWPGALIVVGFAVLLGFRPRGDREEDSAT